MRKKWLLIALCAFVGFILSVWPMSSKHSDLSEIELACSTEDLSDEEFMEQPWVGNNAFLDDFMDSIGYYQQMTGSVYDQLYYIVPVTFWVYRNDDGTGGASMADLKYLMYNLNKYNRINKTGFGYYLKNVNFVDKTKRTTAGFYLEAPMMTSTKGDNHAIDVHLVDKIEKKVINGRARSSRGVYHKASKSIIIKKNPSSTTLAHEIGHYWGLLHTHHYSEKGKCRQEAVSRTRKFKACFHFGRICESSGDGLCDTPADPNLKISVSINCEYTGNMTDNWGDRYAPQISNIMGYPTYRKCRSDFTQGQIAVMLHSAQRKSEQSWIVNKGGQRNKAYFFDFYEPDNSRDIANILKYDTPQHHTFNQTNIQGDKNTNDDEDWFKFRVNSETQRITISTEKGVFSDADTKIYLFEEDMSQVTFNDNARAGTGYSEISRTGLKEGWYYIQVINMKKVEAPNVASYEIKITGS